MTTVNTSTIGNGKPSTTNSVSQCETITKQLLTNPVSPCKTNGNPTTFPSEYNSNLHTPTSTTLGMSDDAILAKLLTLSDLQTQMDADFYSKLSTWTSQDVLDFQQQRRDLTTLMENLELQLTPDCRAHLNSTPTDEDEPVCPECAATGFEMCSECGYCDECCDCSTQLAEDDSTSD